VPACPLPPFGTRLGEVEILDRYRAAAALFRDADQHADRGPEPAVPLRRRQPG
jgi:hypothetical protein